MNKICTKCKVNKPLLNFHKRKSSVDGYRTWCKSCRNTEYEINKETRLQYDKEWYCKNKENKKAYVKKWSNDNKEQVAANHKKLISKYLKENINYKLAHNLRNRLNKAIKHNWKSGSAVGELGCSIKEFKFYIESKFEPGMTWGNWSRTGWHIDHIKPLGSFDLFNPQELRIACHYVNLQPIWHKDHIIKTISDIKYIKSLGEV